MKVLIISRGYPNIQKPLEGNFEASQAKALKDAGHEVIVAYVNIRSLFRIKQYGFKYSVDNGIKVCEFTGILPAIPRIPHLPFTPVKPPVFIANAVYASSMEKLYKAVAAQFGTPDIVHTHYLYISGFTCFIKTKYNVPLVCTEHWSELAKTEISKETRRLSKVYSVADSVIAVSKPFAQDIGRHFNISCTVIPNLLDDQFLKKGKRPETKNNFSFITIGRFSEIKCYDLLIKAFSEARLPESTTLKIVGDGEEANRLKRLAETSGLAGRIKFPGQKNLSEINRMLEESHVFVSSSRRETFGVVHIEAMSKGLPVLSTRSGGPEDFITEEVGILVEPDSIRSLAAGMKRIYEEYENYNADNIREFCLRNFSPDTIAGEITALYENILRSKNGNGKQDC